MIINEGQATLNYLDLANLCWTPEELEGFSLEDVQKTLKLIIIEGLEYIDIVGQINTYVAPQEDKNMEVGF